MNSGNDNINTTEAISENTKASLIAQAHTQSLFLLARQQKGALLSLLIHFQLSPLIPAPQGIIQAYTF